MTPDQLAYIRAQAHAGESAPALALQLADEVERLQAQVREARQATLQVMRQRDEAYDLLETASLNLGCSVEDFLDGLQADDEEAAS
jgi:hypothetical protein